MSNVYAAQVGYLTFSFTFAVYMQIWLVFSLLLLIFIVNLHYMLQANWPSSHA
jgi:hypothetical protein